MPRVYCDNPFYDSIAKEREGFAHGDVEHFRALSGRVIRSYFSPVNGDEILAQWASDRAVALQRLAIARLAEFFDRELREVAKGGPNADQLAAKVGADVTRLKHDGRKQMADARDQVLTAITRVWPLSHSDDAD